MPPDEVDVADEGLAGWVAEVRAATGPTYQTLGAQGLRAASRARAITRARGPDLPFVQDLAADGGLPLRLYRPALDARPLVVFLHGGGFVMGDLDSHDSLCRQLARTADVAVLAVDYRLAPEHPAPAAVDDAVTTFEWALGHAQELGGQPHAGGALAGDSAGGALAVLAAVRLVERGSVPSGLLLAYPNADLTLSEPSVEEEGQGWGLEADELHWFVEQWVPDPARRTDPEVSPLRARLAGLPATLIATAEHDPLRDEGEALADGMRAAGVEVDHRPHPGLVHGFLGLGQVSPAAARAGRDLFQLFGRLVHRQLR